MRIVVLGSAAGGGFPQWNCACPNCARARNNDRAARSRTQTSLAVSADGEGWLLLNAAPDLREQIAATPSLQPRAADPGVSARASPIRAVALSGGDVDAVAGLLHLRESQPLALYASRRVLTLLAANPMFRVLTPASVSHREILLGRTEPLSDFASRPLGLTVEAFTVPGKVALYAEEEGEERFGTTEGDTVGFAVSDDAGACFHFVPTCAAFSEELLARLRGSQLVFFDGTLWTDDEMIRFGLGTKTGRRMGHLSVSGTGGTLAGLAALGIARKVFVHVNNSNPMILEDSPERAIAARAGWEVAHDGMEIAL
ncbi:MAG TPA: pyrroloquinoline quinone biosynthesis protein PqqB [Acetobacteraceae bacterium]|nr:pyrroloquinoline quinone biosynthesis protein PqqB [Acetobacteraceae bacterium]